MVGSSPGAGGGIGGSHSGTSSPLTASRAADVTPSSGASPTAPEMAPPIRSPARAPRSTRSQRRAARSATRSSRGPCSAVRSSLTSLPVSIPSGHACAQLPSAAQVCSPSYSYSSTSARSRGEPGGCRAISRRRTMRCRGVVVRSRLGQTGSQNPHSTQVVADSSISGVVFRLARWHSGSRLRSTPGPSTPSGSASSLIRHISAVAAAPHSRSRNGAMLIPVPCSALSEPS